MLNILQAQYLHFIIQPFLSCHSVLLFLQSIQCDSSQNPGNVWVCVSPSFVLFLSADSSLSLNNLVSIKLERLPQKYCKS